MPKTEARYDDFASGSELLQVVFVRADESLFKTLTRTTHFMIECMNQQSSNLSSSGKERRHGIRNHN